MRTANRGIAGVPTCLSANGQRCVRIIPPMATRGRSSHMITPARAPTAGVRMACWGSATTRVAYVSPWPCGTRPIPSSKRAFPYTDLVATNRNRSRQEPEYELIDTGVFAQDRYFDVSVEYAKVDPTDLLIRLR